jgi:hypothetical protein
MDLSAETVAAIAAGVVAVFGAIFETGRRLGRRNGPPSSRKPAPAPAEADASGAFLALPAGNGSPRDVDWVAIGEMAKRAQEEQPATVGQVKVVVAEAVQPISSSVERLVATYSELPCVAPETPECVAVPLGREGSDE